MIGKPRAATGSSAVGSWAKRDDEIDGSWSRGGRCIRARRGRWLVRLSSWSRVWESEGGILRRHANKARARGKGKVGMGRWKCLVPSGKCRAGARRCRGSGRWAVMQSSLFSSTSALSFQNFRLSSPSWTCRGDTGLDCGDGILGFTKLFPHRVRTANSPGLRRRRADSAGRPAWAMSWAAWWRG